MRGIWECRQRQKKRDNSSSDEDLDDFKPKASGGFGAKSVAGSRIGGLSSAMSHASGSKASVTGRGGPLNITSKRGAPIPIITDPMADLGVPAWNEAVKELIDTREKLEAHQKKPKKKKKKKKGKGANSLLKRTATTYSEAASEWDDGATSAYTSRQSQDDLFAGILVDYCFTNHQDGNAPRGFKSTKATWMLEKMGIANYDDVQAIDKLVFTVQDAVKEAKFQWRTIDLGRIKQITKLVIVRELNMLDGRKDAQKYAATRVPTISDFEMDVGGESVVKSQAALSQYSGSRGSPSPAKRQHAPALS